VAQQLPAGYVADYGNERVGSRAHEAFRLRFSVQPKLAVDAADDQIEAA